MMAGRLLSLFGRAVDAGKSLPAAPAADRFNADGLRRFAPAALFLFEAGLAAALGVTVSRLAWLAITPAGTAARETPLLAGYGTEQTAQAGRFASLERLENDVPFAAFAGAARAPEAEVTTELNLALKGVRTMGANGDGAAIISVSGKSAARFKRGDEVLPGVFIEAIRSDRVLLRSAQSSEVLLLDRLSAKSPISAAQPAAPAAQPVSAGPVLPHDLVQKVRLEPVTAGGATYGYRLAGSLPADTLKTLGLAQGDVIIAMDKNAAPAFDAADLADRFSAGVPIHLTIDRNGERIDRVLMPLGGTQQ